MQGASRRITPLGSIPNQEPPSVPREVYSIAGVTKRAAILTAIPTVVLIGKIGTGEVTQRRWIPSEPPLSVDQAFIR
jgi:hypothetical protein